MKTHPQVATNSNPYQGLKHSFSFSAWVSAGLVATNSNPYQGLKHALRANKQKLGAGCN